MTLESSTIIEAKWATLSPRDRDAWVAIDVFGWTPVRGPTPGDPPSWRIRRKDAGELPCFTTDDTCAITVLKILVREGWSYTLDGSDTHAEVNFLDGHQETFTTFKSSLAEALCLAALKLKASGITPIRKGGK